MTVFLALWFWGFAALYGHIADVPDPAPVREPAIDPHWLELADCESGSWDANGDPIPGTARWDYGEPGGFTHEGYELYGGGLNFHPDTWTWAAGELGHTDAYPHAYQAPPHVQVEVGEWVRERQTWAAWPVCSRRVGLS